MRLILASASPRRAELLRAAGYAFDVLTVELDERPQLAESPREYVERLAQEKSARAIEELVSGPPKGGHSVPSGPAKAGHSVRNDAYVLGADTAVVVGNEILGKPHDAEDAARMLRRLSGRAHDVMTGVCLRSTTGRVSHVEISRVWFAALTEDQIAWYVASGEWHDKAGGYAIQGLASRFIPRIEGSYSNVVGFPIAALEGLLQRLTHSRSLLASGE